MDQAIKCERSFQYIIYILQTPFLFVNQEAELTSTKKKLSEITPELTTTKRELVTNSKKKP